MYFRSGAFDGIGHFGSGIVYGVADIIGFQCGEASVVLRCVGIVTFCLVAGEFILVRFLVFLFYRVALFFPFGDAVRVESTTAMRSASFWQRKRKAALSAPWGVCLKEVTAVTRMAATIMFLIINQRLEFIV